MKIQERSEAFDFIGQHGGPSSPPGLDLKPEVPASTPFLIGVDLSHRIDVSDLFGANWAAASGGGAGGKPGGGGSGGGTTFTPYTTTASAYNITIEFKGTWTSIFHDIFTEAADRLAQLIVADVPNVSIVGLKGGPKVVDDILITAELKAIDGVNGILGQAGPTSVRTSGYLPATATMQFDIADAATFEGLGLFDEIVTHEMLHSLGFGSIWSSLGLVSGSNFTGAYALAAYRAIGGTGSGVPVETEGGAGTAGSHWSEAVFVNELMTGYIDEDPLPNADVIDPLSAVTVASLRDLGYGVKLVGGAYAGPIDDYSLPA